jgi:hypothetical protein
MTYKIERTGNVLVDHGLFCLTVLSNKHKIEDLTKADFQNFLKPGGMAEFDFIDFNTKSKSFSMVFTVNNLLLQPSYKKHDRKQLYYDYLFYLTESIDTDIKSDLKTCWCCGRETDFNIDDAFTHILKIHGIPKRSEKCISRDLFPLIGSREDAGFYPSASKMPDICPICLFSVHLIPVSTNIHNGKMCCYQTDSDDFTLSLINQNLKENLQNYENQNYHAAGYRDKNYLKKLITKSIENLPDFDLFDLIYIFNFSNSGQNPSCEFLEMSVSDLI